MKVPSNNISDIKVFMQNCLQDLYPPEEISSLFYILMEIYCGMSRIQLHSGIRETINESELLLVYDAIKELRLGKPIQYITGKAWFCGLEFNVNKDVLIPRPETEEIVELILKDNLTNRGLKILDIGTGSGCIGVALKKKLKEAEVWALDISEDALKIASKNAVLHQTDISFVRADILDLEKLPDLPRFDIIVSNPPYVLESEKKLMHKNVLEFEPQGALFVPDNSALLYYKAIFRFVLQNNIEASVYLEINESKADEMIALANEFRFSDNVIVKDINGKDRFMFVNGK